MATLRDSVHSKYRSLIAVRMLPLRVATVRQKRRRKGEKQLKEELCKRNSQADSLFASATSSSNRIMFKQLQLLSFFLE